MRGLPDLLDGYIIIRVKFSIIFMKANIGIKSSNSSESSSKSSPFSFLKKYVTGFVVAIAAASFLPIFYAFAQEEVIGGHGNDGIAFAFLWIAVILIAAKLGASAMERFGQPSVLGELIVGVILGNLFLLGFHVLEPIKHDSIIQFLAELGVVILLFQIGLESNIKEMLKVGPRAFLVACIGVVAPFVLGVYVIGPMLLPGLSQNAYFFLGAALTATSVGITARVFQELKKLQTKEAKIILGAAVLDDVFGLIILAVVTALVTVGSISLGGVSLIMAKSIAFLLGAIIIGHLAAPWVGRFFSKINTGVGMKFTFALSIGLLFAFFAHQIGLAAIVGAFAAGLALDAVHFRFFRNSKMVEEIEESLEGESPATQKKVSGVLHHHSEHHIEDLLEPLAFLFIPIFFVYTGMGVELSVLADPRVVLTALGVTAVAILGKVVAGLAAGDANKLVVGLGMVPRGEVGLIFATIGRGLGVVSAEVFSIIVIMVILTTLITPPLLAFLLQKQEKEVKKPASRVAPAAAQPN